MIRKVPVTLALLIALLLSACGSGEGGSDAAGNDPAENDTAAQAPSPSPLATGPPGLEQVGEFNRPTYLASPPGDPRIFVVEKPGRIVEMVDGQAREPALLDITGRVSTGSEQGLLSMAFAPDFARSGLFYVNYTDSDGDTQIVEYQVSGDPAVADPASARTILTLEQPYSNHNGGLVRFGPDGMLLIGMGDGGSGGDPGNRAQDLTTLLGKLLRIDPGSPSDGRPYGIPEDNPYAGDAEARPEIWAYGLRNPWRFSFDPETRDLYVADVGQNRVEEISFVPPDAQAGANYGWRRYEGKEVYDSSLEIDESNLVEPIVTYPNRDDACSVTGGNVHRGPVGSLQGYYLYGDFCEGVVRGFRVEDGQPVDLRVFEDLQVESLSSFGVDSAGETYVLSLSGPVYRIVAAE